MNKVIIIIHTSEIIRKGLAAILRSFFAVEILQLDTVNDLNAYKNMKNNSLIVILQNSDGNNAELFQNLRKNNQLKLILFGNPSPLNDTLPLSADNSINLNSTALEIQEIISSLWKPSDKAVRPQENDELTLREKEVLRLVAMGHSNKIIADKLFISIHTVISHRKNISEKTGIKSISGLTVYAILNNLIDTSTLEPDDLI